MAKLNTKSELKERLLKKLRNEWHTHVQDRLRQSRLDPNANKSDKEIANDALRYIIHQYYNRCELRGLDYGEYSDPKMMAIMHYFNAENGTLDEYLGEMQQGRSVISGQAEVDSKYKGAKIT